MPIQRPRVNLLPPYPTQPMGDVLNQFTNIYLWGGGVNDDLAGLKGGLANLTTALNSLALSTQDQGGGFTGAVTISATDAFTVVDGRVQSVIAGGGGSAGITQLTGDVTAGPGSGSQVATIPDNTVTYAKMQDVSAASRILGRGSAAGSGDVQELTLGTGLTMSGTVISSTPAANIRTIGISVDGGGVVLTSGVKGDIYVPFACTITGVTLLSDTDGSVVIDIWKNVFANYPPTDADSITGGNEPELSTADTYQDTTLTGWTTAISAGDTLRFNIDGSPATLTRVVLQLTVTVP